MKKLLFFSLLFSTLQTFAQTPRAIPDFPRWYTPIDSGGYLNISIGNATKSIDVKNLNKGRMDSLRNAIKDTAAALRNAIGIGSNGGALSADNILDGTTNKAYTAGEKTKLAGIAPGATANSSDAQLRDRSTHTGVQPASSITQDANNRFSTDVEKAAWNAKQNALGYTPLRTADTSALLQKSDSTIANRVTANTVSLASKQPLLASGITIKTVNGTPLLGSGDLAIAGAVYTTVSGLRSITSPVPNQMYQTSDYGSGFWLWSSTSTAAEDTGTVIKVPSIPTGRFLRQYSGAVNPIWFGAKGDWNEATRTGTDNDNVFTYVLNYFSDIYIPDGNFSFKGQVLPGLNGITPPKKQRITCAPNAYFMPQDDYTGSQYNQNPHIFDITQKTKFEWHGGNYDGRTFTKNLTNPGDSVKYNGLLWVQQSRNVIIENIRSHDNIGSMIQADNDTDIVIRSNTFLHTDFGMQVLRCFRSRIEENTITGDSRRSGINARHQGGIGILVTQGRFATMKNNFIDSTADTGSKTEGTDDIVYDGNIVKHMGKDGIKIQGYTINGVIVSSRVNNAQVINNHLDSSWYSREDASTTGISILGCKNFLVSNNIVRGGGTDSLGRYGGGYGVRTQIYQLGYPNEDGVIANNHFYNLTSDGFNIIDVNHLLIIGNEARWDSTSNSNYAINMDKHNFVTIKNNKFFSNSFNIYGVSLGGTRWTNVTIDGNEFKGTGNGMNALLGAGYHGSLIFRNNILDSIGAEAINIPTPSVADTLAMVDFSNNIISHTGILSTVNPPLQLDLSNTHVDILNLANTHIADNGTNPIPYVYRILNGDITEFNKTNFQFTSSNAALSTINTATVFRTVDYLPITGGTLNIPTTGNHINFAVGGVNKGFIGWSNTGSRMMFGSLGNLRVDITAGTNSLFLTANSGINFQGGATMTPIGTATATNTQSPGYPFLFSNSIWNGSAATSSFSGITPVMSSVVNGVYRIGFFINSPTSNLLGGTEVYSMNSDGNFNIGTATSLTSAKFQVATVTQGSRPVPLMTYAQMIAIASPNEGVQVEVSDYGSAIYKYSTTRTRWEAVSMIYLTTTARTGFANTYEGLGVWDTDLHKEFHWDGTVWQASW